MKFVIIGNPVTKKNSQQIAVNKKTNRPFIMPSAKYRDYEKDAIITLLEQASGFTEFEFPIDFPVNICSVYYMATKRNVDTLNLLEATDDILVKAGILLDDNCTIASRHDGSDVRCDKDRPRVEIEITPIIGETEWPYL